MDFENWTAPILTVFSGEDGGAGYVRLRQVLDDIGKQATAGDPASIQICTVVTQFSALCAMCTKDELFEKIKVKKPVGN